MNKVFIMGRFGKSPELRTTESGKSFMRASLAVPREYGEKNAADFFNITAWGKTAETIAQYFDKGKPILVEGHLQTNKYDDKNGQTHYNTEILVDRFNFIPKNDGAKAENTQSEQPSFDDVPEDLTEDDLPF